MRLFLLVIQLQSILWLAAGVSISKPGCQDHCGDVTIPYPFGIGEKCYHNTSYEIVCNTSSHPSKPWLRGLDLEVTNISLPGSYFDNSREQTLTVRMKPQKICDGGSGSGADLRNASASPIDLRRTPYRFAGAGEKYNEFVAKGCSGGITVWNETGGILTACTAMCRHGESTNCDYEIGCCRAPMHKDVDFYKISPNGETGAASQHCNTTVALMSFDDFKGDINIDEPVSTVLTWRIGPLPHLPPQVTSDRVICDVDSCYCSIHHEGNPYLPSGCQVDCSYYDWLHTCRLHHLLRLVGILGFSLGIGLVLMLIGGCWLYRLVKRKREIKRKSNYFKRNGGLLLQKHMSSAEGCLKKVKIFTATELEKATDNFNENRILGRGGQGTVYKGMLLDGRIIAIKKSKGVDETQLEQFINELVILSQISHRNIVKLLGCCLETEVPLLVYEFIPNGTLYQHINEPNEEFPVNMKMRLQIAAESAGAVAYLHSSSSTPIYHRDIKSSNILLDEKYRAKVSDFGTSRAITIEQTHVTTCVQGTYGYLDPEYFQSHQFTEKSDVYSFGVVLVELITGKKPIRPAKSGGWVSLAAEFLFHMENSSLFDILDRQAVAEGKEEEFVAVATLARECLNMNGKHRPTMKEVSMRLEDLVLPNACSLNKPNCEEGEHVYVSTDMSDMLSSSPFTGFSDDHGPPVACSIEIQPLMAIRPNTL